MRKTFSITNAEVIDEIEESANASELLEVAILYYRGEVSEEYVKTFKTIQRATKLLKEQKKLLKEKKNKS